MSTIHTLFNHTNKRAFKYFVPFEFLDRGDIILPFGVPCLRGGGAERPTNVRAQNASGQMPRPLYPSLLQYIFVCMGLTHAEIVFGANIELLVANIVLETHMCLCTELRILYLA